MVDSTLDKGGEHAHGSDTSKSNNLKKERASFPLTVSEVSTQFGSSAGLVPETRQNIMAMCMGRGGCQPESDQKA